VVGHGDRTGERDLIPMAREMGLGVIPYSPLGGGLLTGKYSRDDLTATNLDTGESSRKSFNAALGMVNERNLDIADTVKEMAAELGHTSAQVGLAWALQNPGVTAPIIGARTPAQLEDNLGALDVALTAAQLDRLNAVSATSLGFPHDFLVSAHGRTVTRGDMTIDARR
jgi:aryl-alcohol dehydrogenase-like predicted oxidoreductase